MADARRLTQKDILALFQEVDNLLSGRQSIELVIAGGAAMTEWRDMRATTDVDVISDTLPRYLRDAAAEVAERHNLGYRWLNDNAVGYAPPGLEHVGDVFFVGRRLKVRIPNAKCMLAMKLFAARSKDMEDAKTLAIKAGITSEKKLTELFVQGYGERHLSPKRRKFIELAATGIA